MWFYNSRLKTPIDQLESEYYPNYFIINSNDAFIVKGARSFLVPRVSAVDMFWSTWNSIGFKIEIFGYGLAVPIVVMINLFFFLFCINS